MNGSWTGSEAELNRQLREAAKAGHGVLTTEDFDRLGVSEGMVRTRRKSGLLIPVTRGVVTLPGARLSEKGTFRAATHAGGRNCFLSHRSAAAIHGLVRHRGPVHITRTSGNGRSPAKPPRTAENFGFIIECHQARSLPAEHVTLVEGIRTVTPERALLGLAAEATGPEIGKALSQGERERVICWSTLRQLVGQTNGIKGLGQLKREIDEWIPGYADARSDPEEDFLRAILRDGLPIPAVNQPIGDVVPDFLWPELCLVVELDPYGTHKGYGQFHRDRRKGVLLEKLGLRVIRFTWDDEYRHLDRTLRELREIMTHQARLVGRAEILETLTGEKQVSGT